MATTAPTQPEERANGLATYLNVIMSPTAAFQQLAKTPMWGWAALIGTILMLVSLIIMLPEQLKLVQIEQAKALAQMSSDQAAQARQGMAATAGVTNVIIIASAFIIPWFIWVISSIVYVIGAAISGASAKFSLAWVTAVNSCAVAFLGAIVNSIIVALSGPDAIGSPADLQRIPSLAMLFPDNVKLDAFLAAFSIAYIWFYVVAIIGLEQTMKMKRPAAIVTVLLYAVIAGGLGALFAR
jgi:hypothetical protein